MLRSSKYWVCVAKRVRNGERFAAPYFLISVSSERLLTPAMLKAWQLLGASNDKLVSTVRIGRTD